MQFFGAGGSCPRGHGRIYPAESLSAWRAIARRAWLAALPVANYVGRGLYVVVGRPELSGVKLMRAKEKDEWQRLKPIKPADFERSREGRFVVVKQVWRKVKEGFEEYKGEKELVNVPIVLAVIEEQQEQPATEKE